MGDGAPWASGFAANSAQDDLSVQPSTKTMPAISPVELSIRISPESTTRGHNIMILT